MHGFVVGSLASLMGIVATVSMVTMLAQGAMRTATDHFMSEDITVDPNLRAEEIQEASEDTGKVLLAAGLSLLLGIGTAVVGGGLAARRFAPRRPPVAEAPTVSPDDVP
jgi:hypothetical protein